MINLKKLPILAGAFMLGSALMTQAVPIPSGPPSAGSGDGLNSHWVQVAVGFKPDNIAEALDTLAKGPGDPGFIAEAQFIVPQINFSDAEVPFGGADPTFAVLYSGFLNVVNGGTYQIRAHHDDGFRLTLGGEVISQFDANTPPTNTTVTLDLAPGFYSLSFLSWEQGGQFVNRLLWRAPGDNDFSLVPQSALFTGRQLQVPDSASSAALLLLSCLALFTGRRCLWKRA